MANIARLSSYYAMIAIIVITIVGNGGRGSVYGDDMFDLSHTNLNDLQDQIPGDLANSNITDKGKKLLYDKCVQVAGEENGRQAYDGIELGLGGLMECVGEIINITAIQIEIEESSPHGELDEVFHKYCLRRDDLYNCIDNFSKKLVPCLEKEEQDNQVTLMRIVSSMLGFICHKGGDQIALFIAEKGPECLSSKKDGIEHCLNSTFHGYMPTGGIDNVESLPKFVMGDKQCQDMQKLEDCIVKELETCQEITPANIVESMFRFIRNETICRSLTAKQSGGKGGATSHLTAINGLSTILYGALLVLYMAVAKYLRA